MPNSMRYIYARSAYNELGVLLARVKWLADGSHNWKDIVDAILCARLGARLEMHPDDQTHISTADLRDLNTIRDLDRSQMLSMASQIISAEHAVIEAAMQMKSFELLEGADRIRIKPEFMPLRDAVRQLRRLRADAVTLE